MLYQSGDYFNTSLLVDKNWAGNSITGQLAKDFIEFDGSFNDLEKKFKNTNVKVLFPTNILPLMSPLALAAVMNDFVSLMSKVKSIDLEWVDR